MIYFSAFKKIAGVIIIISGIVLTGCSDDPTGTDTNPGDPPGNDIIEPLTELPGNQDAPAIDALFDFSATIEVTDEDISIENGTEIIRSIFEFEFVSGTTVGDINHILNKYDARIIDMLPDRPFIIVHIPDPGDLSALRSIIEEIEDEDHIETVWEGEVPSFDMLPDHIDATTPCAGSECVDIEQIDLIKHHLAVRGHAAWNLRGAINGRPWLIIQDWFGDSIYDYNDLFASEFVETDDFEFTIPDDHGYHVLGIINADFDHPSEVTGIFPGTINVRAIDEKTAPPRIISQGENQLVRRIKDILDIQANANIIVNTSLGHPPKAEISDGERWVDKAATLQDNFVHFTSAGNVTEKVPEDTPAYEASSFSYAALGKLALNLKNTFVVENRMTNPDVVLEESVDDAERPWPGCASDTSIMGGNLSAIGMDVYSFTAGSGTAHFTGTSMATPQVAGTAAYMWAVNPSLGVDDIVNLLNKTGRSPEFPIIALCRSEIPAPVIDTYDAVLAAGGDDVREVLLDVNDSGSFTEGDIELFLEEFDERDGILEYSRYDLNGTGQTGGDATDRFDLDHDIEFGTVTQIIEGEEETFNENAVTDTDVLCYYAYSDLYTGSSDKREELLGFICSSDPHLEVHSSKFNHETECAYVSNMNPGGESATIMISNSTLRGPEAPVAVTFYVFEDVPLQGEWEMEIANWNGQILDHQGAWAAIGPENGDFLELKRKEVKVSGHTLGIWSGSFTAQFEYSEADSPDSEEIISVNGEFSGLWRTDKAQDIPGDHPPVYPEECYK